MAELRLSIIDNNTPISPGDKVRFKLKTELDGEAISPFMNLRFPKWPPRIDKIDFKYDAEPYLTQLSASQQFLSIKSYSASPRYVNTSLSKSSSFYEVKFRINGDVSSFTTADKFSIQSASNSQLRYLNNQSFPIKNRSFSASTVTVTNVLTASLTTASSLSVLTASVRVNPREAGKNYKLYAVDDTLLDKLTWNSQVRDILIFAYYQSNIALQPNDSKSNLATKFTITDSPPIYSQVATAYGKKIQYFKKLEIKDGNYIYFWVAIARYKKASASADWEGDWLQKDQNGDPIWSRVQKGVVR